MFYDEEKMINKARENYDNIKIPSNIDDYIILGINRGKKTNKKVNLRKWTSLAASLLIISFIASIAISPAFADYVSQIPGISYFIKIFSNDQGIKSALENDFIEVINISDEHEGIKLTVEGIIIDESRMVIFYNVEAEEEKLDIYLREVEFKNDKGEGLRASYGYSPPQYEEKDKNYKGTIDVSFSEETDITDEITMTVEIGANYKDREKRDRQITGNSRENSVIWDREIDGLFQISFKIDRERFETLKETYIINKEAVVRGQKFTIEKLTIHPTRVEIDIKYDENNSMRIFNFDDLRLVDRKGNEFSGINNGVTASFIGDHAIRLYMQSNYFKRTDELYLQGSKLRALDKALTGVVIDMEKGEIIKQPDDRFELTQINQNNSKGVIEFEFKFEQEVPEEQMNIFSGVGFSQTFRDENGREYSSNYDGTSSTSYEGKQVYKIYKSIKQDENMGQFLTIEIFNYPDVIEETFKIKVK